LPPGLDAEMSELGELWPLMADYDGEQIWRRD
jgi:hypothetical protein